MDVVLGGCNDNHIERSVTRISIACHRMHADCIDSADVIGTSAILANQAGALDRGL
jgi:hypothetical protein